MSKENKNSLLIGGLVSSAGMFITKAIGLLYVAPFKGMVLSENYVYYAAGYELYDLVLTISLAGLPFAIAAIVSKYMEKQDYQTVLLVKRIALGLLAVFGFISALAVVIFVNKFVNTRGLITLQQARIYKNVYLIMALSIFTVPILSAYRGFFQGIKAYNTYSLSQVIEQIVRVSFLLGVGAFFVYILKSERIFAVYAALIATAVSAVAAIFHLAVLNRASITDIKKQALYNDNGKVASSSIIKELFYFALPFLISVILANRFGFSNMVLLPKALDAYGYSNLEVSLYTSLITNESVKLIGIPTVLATGFAVAIIPEMSEALVKKDYQEIEKGIKLSIESVLYIGLPILMMMFLLSDEIYFILFGGDTNIIKMGGDVLKAQTIIAILGNLMPVLNALLMTLDLRAETLKILLLSFILNFILLWFFVRKIGWFGSMLAMIITTFIVVAYSVYIMKKTYAVNFKYTLRKILLMIVSLIAMLVPYFLLRVLQLDVIGFGRFVGILILALYGVLMTLVYLVVSNNLYLPQSILNVDFMKIVKRVRK